MQASNLMDSSKIVQQIMVICRTAQKSVNDIADEMGVAPVYLEDVLEKMVEEKLLLSPAKGKYLSNCCVFPKQSYMRMFFQITGALFHYGWDKHLALPEDYSRSAAGLYLMK